MDDLEMLRRVPDRKEKEKKEEDGEAELEAGEEHSLAHVSETDWYFLYFAMMGKSKFF